MQWYYYSQGQQVGPLSDEAIHQAVRDGQVLAGDHVWNASMGDQWVEARAVPGLFSPPPFAGMVPPAGVAEAPDGDPQAPFKLSVWACAMRAWAQTTRMLFRPFNLGKWLALGFSAWLATLGKQQGGGIFNSGDRDEMKAATEKLQNDPAAFLDQLHATFLEHASLYIGIGSAVVVVLIVVGTVVLWLRCRGQFMFLDNVVHDRAVVTYPWRTFRQHGNSLFVWSLVYTLIGLAVLGLLVLVGVVSILNPFMTNRTAAGLGLVVMGNAFAWSMIVLFFAYISLFLDSFVVPIMYNEDKTVTEAWGRFLGLLRAHGGAFLWYGICYLLWTAVIGICVVVLIFATCCVALCALSVPYIGAVVLLPATVFLRCLGLEYLAQFGPEFRMRREPAVSE